jgi:hypothetical protein
VTTKLVNAFCVNEKPFTTKPFTTPAAAQTKAGPLSCKSFNHKNHSADNAVSQGLLPTQKARQLPSPIFSLQAYMLNQVKDEHRSGDLL